MVLLDRRGAAAGSNEVQRQRAEDQREEDQRAEYQIDWTETWSHSKQMELLLLHPAGEERGVKQERKRREE